MRACGGELQLAQMGRLATRLSQGSFIMLRVTFLAEYGLKNR